MNKEETLKQTIESLEKLNKDTGKQHHIKGCGDGSIKFEVSKNG